MSEIDLQDALLAELDDGVLTMTFNRPEFRNAIAREMTPRIIEILGKTRGDRAVRCVVIRGNGAHFSAGGDVVGFKKSLAQSAASRQAEFEGRLGTAGDMVRAILGVECPIIASIRGGVAGAALAFPLAADLVIADETASFIFAHQRLGLVPDGGVSYLLPRVVGERNARRLVLTAAAVGSAEAEKLGIVDRLVAADELDTATAKGARAFARAPQRAVRTAKAMMAASLDNELDAQLALETRGIVDCVGDDDFAEGVSAFLEKRSAVFPSTR